ncbi:hypothetical protein GE09DRAFT_1218959 [Coniochaeta sp. 2T2.1]|nr:hypothetical protein GE09DRAFT_1218959 [Coniochaeta sp. 2T2.1]
MTITLASLTAIALGLLSATGSCGATGWPTTTTTSTSMAAAPTGSPAAPPALPPVAPFGISVTSPDGQTVTNCFGIDTVGPLIQPADAMALVQLYNQTICSGNPVLTLQAQEGIVITSGSNQLMFKNQVQFPITPSTCDETVDDFVTIVNTCFNGLPAYGGRLIDHVFSNYVIASTAQGALF